MSKSIAKGRKASSVSESANMPAKFTASEAAKAANGVVAAVNTYRARGIDAVVAMCDAYVGSIGAAACATMPRAQFDAMILPGIQRGIGKKWKGKSLTVEASKHYKFCQTSGKLKEAAKLYHKAGDRMDFMVAAKLATLIRDGKAPAAAAKQALKRRKAVVATSADAKAALIRLLSTQQAKYGKFRDVAKLLAGFIAELG